MRLEDDPPRALANLCATERGETSTVFPSGTIELWEPNGTGPRAATDPALGSVCLLPGSLSQESSYAGGSSPESERARPVGSGPQSWCRASVRRTECWVGSGTGVGAILGVPNVLGAAGRMSPIERKRHREEKTENKCSRSSAFSSLLRVSGSGGARVDGYSKWASCVPRSSSLPLFLSLHTTPASTMTIRPSTPPTTPPTRDVCNLDLDCPPAPEFASEGCSGSLDEGA